VADREPVLRPAGDQAIVVDLGDAISPETNRRVHNLALAMEESDLAGVVDLVPTYSSLLVYYDPLVTTFQGMSDAILEVESGLDDQPSEPPRTVHLPTLYGGQYGPDVKSVADHAGLTEGETVSAHSGTDYLVYMLGFSPGCPYLGGLSDTLATPRLETPRTEIPAGSVGIAESQTGVYPVASPGGWQIIGRTPLKLFDACNEPPSLLKAGDFVRFVPLSTEREFLEIDDLVKAGDYRIVSEPGQ
jgi:KipI family sensor histidine kinase inhibitor